VIAFSNLADAAPGRTGIRVADRPPPLRLLPSDADAPKEATVAPPKKRALPKGLYLPTPEMQTIWCRFSIDGHLYRQSTGCRDVRNAERRAAAIRVELEAAARGVALPKRLLLKDAIRDFGRHILTGRGGADRQEKNIRLLLTVLGPHPAKFVDELSLDIYDAFVVRVKKPTERCPEGFTQSTIHCYAQVIRRFGRWLEDTDRVHKSPFRQVPLERGRNHGKRRRALPFDDLNALLGAARQRQIQDAGRTRVNAGVSDPERVRLRGIGRRRALFMRTIARSGIRPGELRKVRIQHLDLPNDRIFLPAPIVKGRRPEVAHLTQDLSRRLAALVRSSEGDDKTRLLFPNTLPNWRTIDRDIAAAGLAKEDARGRTLSLYSLRKTFSTHLRMCGVDDDMIGRLMRHAGTSLNSTTYTDEDLLDLREPMRLLDERDRRERRAWQRRWVLTMATGGTPPMGPNGSP
jgi:integrase